MRVVVTDGMMNKSLAVVRAIDDYASTIGVTSTFPISVAGVSRCTDAQHWIRSGDDAGAYVESLNRIIADHRYDQVLPVGGRSFELVSEYRSDLDAPVERILPSRESMRVAVEKAKTYELAEELGVPTPTTITVSSADDEAVARDTIGFPAVVKTGVETGTRFVRVVRSADELASALAAYRRDHAGDPLVQEYLPGVGRGFFALYIDGVCVDGYTHRRIREYPPEGGASACAESTDDEELRAYSDRLLSALDWHGVAMVEFKEARDGTPHVVEINPKFWGSLDLGIQSGLNFPRALLEYSAGREEFAFEFSSKRYSWPLSGDLTHAWRRPSSASTVLADLVSSRTHTNLRFSDPAPHVVEALVTIVRQDL